MSKRESNFDYLFKCFMVKRIIYDTMYIHYRSYVYDFPKTCLQSMPKALSTIETCISTSSVQLRKRIAKNTLF